MKTREQREAELHQLTRTETGKAELVRHLKQLKGLAPGQTLPSGTLLIAEILRHEFERKG